MKDCRFKINGNEFKGLAAITAGEQEKGLMWVASPQIMVFPCKFSSIRKFWMKNTPMPLDIVFCNDGKILSINSGEPFSTKLVGPNKPTNLIIEFPAGTCDKFNIGVGDSVELCDDVGLV